MKEAPDQCPDTLTIRDARPGDERALLHMIAALATHHGDVATIRPDDLGRDLFGSPWLYALIATSGEQAVGYAALCPLAQLQFGKRGLDLHHLYVAPEARGRGVGAALVAAARDKARFVLASYLAVGATPDNLQAQAFYRAQGFVPISSGAPRFSLKLEG